METWQPETVSQEKFVTTLSASLHQMAQPMATIQASLELALLSPSIVDAALKGSRPLRVSTQSLVKEIELDPSWRVQEQQVFG